MRITLKTLVLSSAALCATAAFAANQARVDVPFSFTAKGQSYPAGKYDVALDSTQNFVTLACETDAAKHITWEVGPGDAAKTPAVITFDTAGVDHSLKSIQMGDKVTPNLDTTSKHGVSATTSIGGQ